MQALRPQEHAPAATARRVISARPRVMSAARPLLPKPSPSLMPHAMASTFFSAPPSSTPAGFRARDVQCLICLTPQQVAPVPSEGSCYASDQDMPKLGCGRCITRASPTKAVLLTDATTLCGARSKEYGADIQSSEAQSRRQYLQRRWCGSTGSGATRAPSARAGRRPRPWKRW